jgi:hypothetical protein
MKNIERRIERRIRALEGQSKRGKTILVITTVSSHCPHAEAMIQQKTQETQPGRVGLVVIKKDMLPCDGCKTMKCLTEKEAKNEGNHAAH